MIKYLQTRKGDKIAELCDDERKIADEQDILDLIGEISADGCSRLIVHEENLGADFFDLKTGIAGEMLQKISNYRFRIAVIGDFEKFKSKSLHDFIRECNRGESVFFSKDLKLVLDKI